MDELIRNAIESYPSMTAAQASISHMIGKQAFKERAKAAGIWRPGGRGRNISLNDILTGKVKHYHSSLLRRRLISEHVKEEKCECCGNSRWMGRKIPLTLHHIDGNNGNNKLENLQILCYNCHALTENFSGLNKKT